MAGKKQLIFGQWLIAEMIIKQIQFNEKLD